MVLTWKSKSYVYPAGELGSQKGAGVEICARLLALPDCVLCEFIVKHLVVSLGLIFARRFVSQEGKLDTKMGRERKNGKPPAALYLFLIACG